MGALKLWLLLNLTITIIFQDQIPGVLENPGYYLETWIYPEKLHTYLHLDMISECTSPLSNPTLKTTKPVEEYFNLPHFILIFHCWPKRQSSNREASRWVYNVKLLNWKSFANSKQWIPRAMRRDLYIEAFCWGFPSGALGWYSARPRWPPQWK